MYKYKSIPNHFWAHILLSCECIGSLDLFFTITYSPHHRIAQPLSTRKLRCETAREASFEATAQVNLLDASISCFVTGVRASLVHTGTFYQDLLTFFLPHGRREPEKDPECFVSACDRSAEGPVRNRLSTSQKGALWMSIFHLKHLSKVCHIWFWLLETIAVLCDAHQLTYFQEASKAFCNFVEN